MVVAAFDPAGPEGLRTFVVREAEHAKICQIDFGGVRLFCHATWSPVPQSAHGGRSMSREYNYSRKRGTFAGHYAEKRRDFRRILLMLLVGGAIIGYLVYLILSK